MSSKLSLDELKELLVEWRANNNKEALTKIVMSNNRLVISIARKYMGKGLSFDELKSAGYEGLINAINKFDYIDRAIEGFSTYIYIAIENSIRYDLKKYNKHKHVMSFEEPIGHSKDGDELTVEDIVGTDEEELLDEVISEIKNDILREALQSLTSREKKIIFLRYGLDETHKKTLEEVAKILNCTRQLISKQEQKALMKMRHPRNTRKLKDFIEY